MLGWLLFRRYRPANAGLNAALPVAVHREGGFYLRKAIKRFVISC
jgi:hypothetical protein